MTDVLEEGDLDVGDFAVADSVVHDLENVGDSVLRFVTVELLR